MKQEHVEPRFKDPVCSMEVSRTTAAAEYEYQGKTYYFCAPTCRDAFSAEPERYVRRYAPRTKRK